MERPILLLVGPDEQAAIKLTIQLVPYDPIIGHEEDRQAWIDKWRERMAAEDSLSESAAALIDFIASLARNQKIFLKYPESGLYPEIQSHVANPLIDAHEEFELQFVVLTNSDCLIRRSQVLVKRYARHFSIGDHEIVPDDCKIPFEVRAFRHGKEKILQYTKSGRFDGDFYQGFYDESTILSYQLL